MQLTTQRKILTPLTRAVGFKYGVLALESFYFDMLEVQVRT